MPEFYMIFAHKLAKYPNFYDICPKNARIFNARKIFFPKFWAVGGTCSAPPDSYAYGLTMV